MMFLVMTFLLHMLRYFGNGRIPRLPMHQQIGNVPTKIVVIDELFWQWTRHLFFDISQHHLINTWIRYVLVLISQYAVQLFLGLPSSEGLFSLQTLRLNFLFKARGEEMTKIY